METIYLRHPIDPKKIETKPNVMALGYFDGVHKGHQEVIKAAAAIAIEDHLQLTVMTFHPHPKEVLGKSSEPMRYLTPLEDKLTYMEKLGVERIYIISFTEEFAKLSPEQFVDEYLSGLNVKHAVAGFDFTYGALGRGNMESLPGHAKGQFSQTIVPKLEYGNLKISSSHIRELLERGEVEEIPNNLNRYYKLKGLVIDGDKRGRKLGFPTANIQMEKRYVTPRIGVYGVRVTHGQSQYFGVCNLGYAPTFNKTQKTDPSIEVHLLQYDGDLYGEELEVEWIFRIRPEKKFADFNDLVTQIEADKQTAITYFAENQLAF
ncbi:riboflavin biosynthesis protein RibF [Alkalihalobacillus alcalophilus ATCC 27647 = CGMCC 1.3604]|uniref:Riboflavin biosynthesis protein n=1 Tax=Alkalihalobacillus alcalophilus ATCC 27647 = CGMCC 1.3604 TaxID=1218173 RepID=A0A094WMX0_ALKAL|nr:riboflavin biosynthesis protein RibF [Alkalihalobacillus alcalophilus]KGA98206.1 riboflavin biosynthesis protein RibF [Alkalihalobacillus alcalophilus ATCC 27647 = CGMCC 1.3604]MED1562145.1 riboflavin biosynthesis protein RibF [Alkalihalobacillus alcalophilus]THG91370.1 riboflavin biosynthesis protein RibF [Alkalihalobacillus alcalophilus ATCC 27647 = CGMCC 1.3604]